MSKPGCQWQCRGPSLGLCIMTLVLAACVSAALAVSSMDEKLIGWQGETYNTGAAEKGATRGPNEQWIETISWSPRAFIYHNFLSQAECDHMVGIGTKRVSRSLVVDTNTGASKTDDIRTSFGGAFGRGEDPVIAEIEERIAEWTHLPPENGEPIQILRYVNGQKYDAHWDFFSDPLHVKQAKQVGNRYATVLLYLANVDEGGETILPLADFIDEDAQRLDNPSKCASKLGMAIRPQKGRDNIGGDATEGFYGPRRVLRFVMVETYLIGKGDALLFFDMDIEGSKGDRKALHASCPTLRGTKWTATKWIHNKPYMGKFDAMEMAGRCTDTAPDCKQKAEQGLCDTDDSLIGITGTCRATCKDCEPCPEGDVLCQRRNMRSRRASLLGTKPGGAPTS